MSGIDELRELSIRKRIQALFSRLAVTLAPNVGGVCAKLPQKLKVPSHKRANTEWNVVTLPNNNCNFTMNGVVPAHVVVDAGAKRVMIGMHMADQMGVTEEDLEPRRSISQQLAHWRHHGGSQSVKWRF